MNTVCCRILCSKHNNHSLHLSKGGYLHETFIGLIDYRYSFIEKGANWPTEYDSALVWYMVSCS